MSKNHSSSAAAIRAFEFAVLGDGVGAFGFVDIEIGVGHKLKQLFHACVVALELAVELGDALAMVLERRICAIAGFGLATLLFFQFFQCSHAEP